MYVHDGKFTDWLEPIIKWFNPASFDWNWTYGDSTLAHLIENLSCHMMTHGKICQAYLVFYIWTTTW